MIAPTPNRLVQWWFDGWCRRAMARQFYRLHRWGDLPPPGDAADGRGTLYLPNHSAVWDGIVLWRLLRPLHRRLLCVVDEGQMREHPFFARLGCFSIDRTRPRDARRSLDYAADRLREPGVGLVLFPQGRITHADRRPLGVEAGVGRLVTAARPRVVTIGLRYDYWQEQRGEVLVDVAAPEAVAGDRRAVVAWAERRLTAQLDALAERSRAYAVAPSVTRVGPESISHWKERWRGDRTTGDPFSKMSV